MAEKIILDVDTGTDDAVAIMAAVLCDELQVEAICSVSGNKPVKNTTENTLRVLQALGSDIPVYRGCSQPLVKNLDPARAYDNSKGKVVDGKELHIHPEYLDLPEAKRGPEYLPAPMFYVDYLRKASEPITIVAVGPLTNVAAALILDRTIVSKIKRIIVMGGGYRIANCTPCAEFNIWGDPEAAQWVVSCGADVVMVPLDATHATALTPDDCATLRSYNTFAADFAASLAEHRIEVANQMEYDHPNSTPIHDAVAVCAAIDESVLVDLKKVHCDVGLSGFAEGETVVCRSAQIYPDESSCNVRFAFSADKKKFCDWLFKTLSKK